MTLDTVIPANTSLINTSLKRGARVRYQKDNCFNSSIVAA